ncbi:MAG: hypothetical protein L3J65_06145 [Robiginitomaculum sp.]|nr:hypothetical protein [Robiginitomaculum sp.]
MRQLLSTFLVLSLLFITMHSVMGGEHGPEPTDNFSSGLQTAMVIATGDEQLPSDGNSFSTECNICHTAHTLLMLAPDELTLVDYVPSTKHMWDNTLRPAPVDDIPHPPIILI